MQVLLGKVALVTGASRGIGYEIAKQLGIAGAVVAGSATTMDGANKITKMLQDLGIKGKGIVLEVTSQDSIKNALTIIEEDFGSPTILVNNAGRTCDNLFPRLKEQDWEDIININLTGAYRLIKACLRNMLKNRQGRIINIGSVVGTTGNPGQANYAAAKAGLLGLTKSLAKEVGNRNITVNTIAPGFIATNMTESLTAEQHKSLIAQIPAGRIGKPEDIANAVLFLASPCASYITGETLHINGGMFMG